MRVMTVRRQLVAAGILLVAVAGEGFAEVPQLINYQGRLLDANGDPVSGIVSLETRLFAEPTSGDLLYTETNDVNVVNGVYSVMIGASAFTVAEVNGEVIAAGTGASSYAGALANAPVIPTTLTITTSGIILTDQGDGTLSGNLVNTTGTIDYATGDWTADYGSLGINQDLLADYQYSISTFAGLVQALTNAAVFVETVVDGVPLSPRQRLTAVPYAIEAWTVRGPNLYVDPTSGNVGIGTTSPAEQLEVAGAIVLGNTTTLTPKAGTIRWTGSDVEGYKNNEWVSLTVPSSSTAVPLGDWASIVSMSGTNDLAFTLPFGINGVANFNGIISPSEGFIRAIVVQTDRTMERIAGTCTVEALINGVPSGAIATLDDTNTTSDLSVFNPAIIPFQIGNIISVRAVTDNFDTVVAGRIIRVRVYVSFKS